MASGPLSLITVTLYILQWINLRQIPSILAVKKKVYN